MVAAAQEWFGFKLSPLLVKLSESYSVAEPCTFPRVVAPTDFTSIYEDKLFITSSEAD